VGKSFCHDIHSLGIQVAFQPVPSKFQHKSAALAKIRGVRRMRNAYQQKQDIAGNQNLNPTHGIRTSEVWLQSWGGLVGSKDEDCQAERDGQIRLACVDSAEGHLAYVALTPDYLLIAVVV
jgi:hypothetical protein